MQRWGAVVPEDQTLIYRVVGTLEYLSALRNLDAFLRTASREEIAAADKIVTNRPQFTVYTRMADRFRRGAQGQPQPPASDAEKASKKQGLMWVVALARLEAGAILGTFTTLHAPFELVGPSRWELPAYRELLMDGAQTHFGALMNDANVKVIAAKVPDSETLAYIRRLNLARVMLNAAARSNAQELSASDWAQLEEQDRQLLSLRDLFSNRVRWYLQALKSTSTSTSVPEHQAKVIRACSMQLEGERREMAAGTAKTQLFKVK